MAPASVDLSSFLQKRKQNPTLQIVIGNEAGDADSIVSAIAWAYVKSCQMEAPGGTNGLITGWTPVVSIPQADLETQRPETMFLLNLAGVSTNSLTYVDDPTIADPTTPRQVSLVDHNRLTLAQRPQWRVVEVLDHHADLGFHTDAPHRLIAFEDDKATVASTCTLVVEHLTAFPAPLALLLLGVILLDSVNMLPAAGKGTDRDRRAIERLLRETDWQELPAEARRVLRLEARQDVPDATALFQALQGAKFDAAFWRGLSAQDALRLDYKRFEASNGAAFGSSSVLMRLADFGAKPDWEESLRAFMREREIEWLAVLFSYIEEDGATARRQLLLGSTAAPDRLDGLVEFLMGQDLLQLGRTASPSDAGASAVPSLTVRAFEQGNPKASRKQVAPILLEYFSQQS